MTQGSAQTYAVCEKCGQMNRVATDSGKEPVCGKCQAALPVHGAIVDGRDATFSTLVKKSPLPVVVDIWAPWCGPCRAFAPTFESVSQEYAGKMVFVKLNSDENPNAAAQLGVRGIPTLLVFKNGAEVGRQAGAMTKDQFKHWLEA